MRRRREEAGPAPCVKSGDGKGVSWKDGSITKDKRNRTLLKEVFVFTEGSIAMDAIETEDEKSEGASDTAHVKIEDDDSSPGSDVKIEDDDSSPGSDGMVPVQNT